MANKKTIEEVVTAQPTALAVNNMADTRGFENVDMSEVTMPRIKLLQAMSPELDDQDYDFKKGELIHNLIMEKVSPIFIPLVFISSKVMFVPRDNQKRLALLERLGVEDDGSTMMLCRAKDGKNVDMSLIGRNNCAECGYHKWDGNTPPICTSSISILALFDGLELPAVFQFANTNWKYGRKFRDMAMYSGGALFGKKYRLDIKQEENDKGKFFVTPVKPAGVPTEEEFRKAEAMYNRFSNVRIVVDEDEGDEE